MEIKYERGLILEHNNYKILLDPEYRKTPIKYHTLVSHSHADHTQAIPGSSTTHLNQITLDLFNVTHKPKARSIVIEENYQPFELGPFEIEFIDAGHLLGAVQMVVRAGNDSFLYTGDFCPEPLLTVNGADTAKDITVMALDATYGDQRLRFKSRNSARTSILTWIVRTLQEKQIPVINVTRLGGAQEIISYLNKMLPDLPIFVTPKILAVNGIFKNHNVMLEYNKLEKVLPEKCVVLVPRSTKELSDLVPDSTRVSRCIVTGQSAKFGFSKFNNAVPLSTHASFEEIMTQVKEVEPQHILTNFGFHRELAEYITDNTSIHCAAESVKETPGVDCEVFNSKSNNKNIDSKTDIDFYFND